MAARTDHSGPFATKTVLPNGVRIVTERLEHVGSVSLGLWAIAGSRNDAPGREGIAHFLEHMLFKGTTARSARQIAEAIDDIGGNVNGVTDRDEMHLYARTASDHTEAALELLFDLLLHSTCAAGDVSKEREVVLQEIAHVRDSPEEWMHEVVPETVWAGHSLGRPLMGTWETVQRIACDALREFLAEDIQAADRLLVTAAGDLDHERLVELTRAHTADLEPSSPCADGPPPVFHGERRLISERGAQVHFCWVAPGISRTDDRRHAFAVLDTLLGGGSSSRLFQEIRENRGLAYEISSYLQAYREAGLFIIAAGTAPGNFQLVLDLIEEEVARLRNEGPSHEELARAKVQIKVAVALAAESTSFRMHHLAASEMHWGRVLSFEEVIAGVEGVTAEDVHSLARTALSAGQNALVAIGPFDGEGSTG